MTEQNVIKHYTAEINQHRGSVLVKCKAFVKKHSHQWDEVDVQLIDSLFADDELTLPAIVDVLKDHVYDDGHTLFKQAIMAMDVVSRKQDIAMNIQAEPLYCEASFFQPSLLH